MSEASVMTEAVQVGQRQRSIKANQSVSHRERWHLCKHSSHSHCLFTRTRVSFQRSNTVFLFLHVTTYHIQYICSLPMCLLYVCCIHVSSWVFHCFFSCDPTPVMRAVTVLLYQRLALCEHNHSSSKVWQVFSLLIFLSQTQNHKDNNDE